MGIAGSFFYYIEGMDKYRKGYSAVISGIGVLLVLTAVIQAIITAPPLTFVLLIVLGVVSQVTMTSFVEGNAGVSVSSAVSLTAAYLYGPLAGALVAATAEVGLWLMRVWGNRADKAKQELKKSFELLGVNVGMNSIAALVAGIVLQSLLSRFGDVTVLGQIVPWLIAAIIGDQVNLWLLIIVIYLVHGAKPFKVWQENKWAIPINVLVMSAGGGLLSLAVQQFDLLGIAIFFLPIVLSAYSFRLTVNSAKKQLVVLEERVVERTQELAQANKQLASTNDQLESSYNQLETSNQKLATLSEEKDSFLAVLTHDMRTPLTSIKGYSSIMRDRELSREQQVKIAKVIIHSQDTLLDIVNNILEIEKLQSGAPILLSFSNFDVALLAQRVIETMAMQAQEKQILLHYAQVPTPVMVSADVSKIERIITNLVSNAIKYTAENGTVSVDVGVNGRYATIIVKDTGYGIPEDQLPYIFERYSRVKGHQHLAIGTGLGLAIVKSLVEAHKGHITVTSEEDVGSIFTLKLPL